MHVSEIVQQVRGHKATHGVIPSTIPPTTTERRTRRAIEVIQSLHELASELKAGQMAQPSSELPGAADPTSCQSLPSHAFSKSSRRRVSKVKGRRVRSSLEFGPQRRHMGWALDRFISRPPKLQEDEREGQAGARSRSHCTPK